MLFVNCKVKKFVMRYTSTDMFQPSPAQPWICCEEQGMKNIYDSDAQCVGSRQKGQLDLADVHTILAGEEFKVFF